jgi:hypothetical protein
MSTRTYRSFAGSSLFPWTKWSLKLDHNFSENHKISGLYNYGLSEVLPGVDGFPRLPGAVSDFRYTKQDSHVWRVNYTWTINPNDRQLCLRRGELVETVQLHSKYWWWLEESRDLPSRSLQLR